MSKFIPRLLFYRLSYGVTSIVLNNTTEQTCQHISKLMTVLQNSGPILTRNRPLTKILCIHGRRFLIVCRYIGGTHHIYINCISKCHPCIQAFFVRGPVPPQSRPWLLWHCHVFCVFCSLISRYLQIKGGYIHDLNTSVYIFPLIFFEDPPGCVFFQLFVQDDRHRFPYASHRFSLVFVSFQSFFLGFHYAFIGFPLFLVFPCFSYVFRRFSIVFLQFFLLSLGLFNAFP